jgi:hypothetical protein
MDARGQPLPPYPTRAVNILITMAGAKYDKTVATTVRDAPGFGADRVLVYDDVWLKAQADYMRDTKWLWEHPRTRGLGWFAFKPYMILDALRRHPDDTIFYIDGDTFPLAPLTPFFEITARDGIMLFRANGWPRADVWTKREMFQVMGLDEERYWGAPCGCARFMGFTKKFVPLLSEWYGWCLKERVTTFDVNPAVQQRPGFRENRCEQACLGLLAARDGIKLWREADEFGDTVDATNDHLLDRDAYPRSFTQIWGDGEDHGQGSRFRNV